MELVSAYLELKKARTWKKERVNFFKGAYGSALKSIYGDKHVHVDLYANRKAHAFRQEFKKPVYYSSEIV